MKGDIALPAPDETVREVPRPRNGVPQSHSRWTGQPSLQGEPDPEQE